MEWPTYIADVYQRTLRQSSRHVSSCNGLTCMDEQLNERRSEHRVSKKIGSGEGLSDKGEGVRPVKRPLRRLVWQWLVVDGSMLMGIYAASMTFEHHVGIQVVDLEEGPGWAPPYFE